MKKRKTINILFLPLFCLSACAGLPELQSKTAAGEEKAFEGL